MSRVLRLVVLLLLTAACSPPRDFPVVVHLDARWTDDEAQTIEDALAEWEWATCGFAATTPVRGWRGEHGDGVAIYRETSAAPYLKGVLATTWGDSIAVAVDRVEYWDKGELLHRVLLHELGHLWGLEHEQYGVMSIDVYAPACIDASAVDQFCEVYACECLRPTCST